LKGQILHKMRMQPTASIERMSGSIGGCNAGMWILRDGQRAFVLKLVRTGPCIGPRQQPEADKFAKLCRENPGIVADPSLSFPCKIFRCLQQGGARAHDLVVMCQAPGTRMSEIIMQKLHSHQVQDLMRILEQFGVFLAAFHMRYNNMQHGDLTPANVFYDPRSGRFTLVDVADLAPRNPVIQADTERFMKSLKLLSGFYGPELFRQGTSQFEAGYARRCCNPRAV
jgi:Ser/Thr protein kinase RdoA (MazF antagonist)